MKNFKKTLALVLAAVLLVGATFAATVAWMTAEADDKKNVFTVGDIAIDLDEVTDVEGEGGTVTETADGAEYVGVMPGDHLVKEVTVANTGNVPAYVALTVTVNNAEKVNDAIDVYYEGNGYTAEQIQAVYDVIFEGWGLRYDKKDDEGNALGMRLTNQLPTDSTLLRVDSTKTTAAGDYFFYAYDNWFQSEAEKANTGYGLPVGNGGYYADDMGTYEWNYTYYLYLEPGQSFVPFEGLNAPAFFNNAQMEMFEGLQIVVDASAIQADNMASAKEAFAALAGHNDPVIPDAVASTQEEFAAALAAGESVYLEAGEYRMPSVSGTKEFTVSGTKEAVVDMTWGAYMDSSKVSFDGVTIKTGTGYVTSNGTNFGSDYAALYSPNVTYTNCTFVGPMRVGRDGAAFINCVFTELGNDYVWTYGNDCSFIGCTFNSDGKALLIYSDGGSEVSKVVVEDCVFNATQGAKAGAIANQNCAAIEIQNYGNSVDLTVSGNTVDTNNFSGEWRIKTYHANKPAVIVNGVEYTSIALDGKTMTIDADKNVTVSE